MPKAITLIKFEALSLLPLIKSYYQVIFICIMCFQTIAIFTFMLDLFKEVVIQTITE